MKKDASAVHILSLTQIISLFCKLPRNIVALEWHERKTWHNYSNIEGFGWSRGFVKIWW